MLGCGHCEDCRAGRHHVCPKRLEVGIRDGWAGALAEQGAVPTRFAYEIPEHVSVTAAALVEPGGNSLRAARARKHHAGQTGCARARLRHHRVARRAVRARGRRRSARRRRT